MPKLILIFATSNDEVLYWEKTVSEAQTLRHIGENLMIAQRWNSLQFSYRIPKEEKKKFLIVKYAIQNLHYKKKTKMYTLSSTDKRTFMNSFVMFIWTSWTFYLKFSFVLWRSVIEKYLWAVFPNTFFDYIILAGKQQILDKLTLLHLCHLFQTTEFFSLIYFEGFN